MRSPTVSLLVAVAGLAALPAGAGVTVAFPNPPDAYADIGEPGPDAERNRSEIARYLMRLGERHLRPEQNLRIEVLDVDLAGDRERSRAFFPHDVRVTRGTSDFPRFTLRYTLESGGRVVSSREETIADSSYLWFPKRTTSTESMAHEKQLLEAWFKDRFRP